MSDWLFAAPRRTLALVFAACAASLLFAVVLQQAAGLEPCPMCIVQRYAVIVVGLIAGITALFRSRVAWVTGSVLGLVAAGFGAFVAARQSFLQWYPPETVSCGRDFYGMIETFPLKRALPMIFRGSGDCSKVDWTFLGGSLANWAFVAFVLFAVVFLGVLVRQFAGARSLRTAAA